MASRRLSTDPPDLTLDKLSATLTHMTTARMLAKRLASARKTLSSAESCTGGLIGHTLTNIPGSSAWYKGGVVAYANDLKVRLLGVPAAIISRYGAVSTRTAQAMAENARKRMKSNFAIAVTGIAGPTGGTTRKPVGLVFIAAASEKKTVTQRFVFNGSRTAIKEQSARAAIALMNDVISRAAC